MSMTFQSLFDTYYTLYRGDSTSPATTDPEWKIAIRNYNDALRRLANYDNTKWDFLTTTLAASTQSSPALVRTLSTGDSTYVAPTDMHSEPGIFSYIDTNGNRLNYGIVKPYEVPAIDSNTKYGYFLGNQQAGYTLNVNPAPTATENGWTLDYIYYRKPTELNADTEDGTSVIEGGDPAFYYNHMLAQRFRNSRNYPSYQTALRDSEEALKGMKLQNNSGSFYNAWSLNDTSGSSWGN